jgi:hypothetical protein
VRRGLLRPEPGDPLLCVSWTAGLLPDDVTDVLRDERLRREASGSVGTHAFGHPDARWLGSDGAWYRRRDSNSQIPAESAAFVEDFEGEDSATSPTDAAKCANPGCVDSGLDAARVPSSAVPATSADALALAIKLAIDAGDLDGAAVLLDAARRTRARPVAHLDVVRSRDEGTGKG